MTLRILPYINNPTDLKLDLDIAAFKIEDLVQKEINATTQEILIQRQIELSSSSNQCSAWNHPKNPAKKTRCSQASKKNSTLCFRHSKLQEEGRNVVLVEMQFLALRLWFHQNYSKVVAPYTRWLARIMIMQQLPEIYTGFDIS